MNTINLIIDYTVLLEYQNYYFKKYPRRKKFPIKTPIHPSVNDWMILRRPAMNKLKQDWGEFSEFLVGYHNLNDVHIDMCKITIKSYMPTKRRFDLDNLTPKFILDGLVHAGLLADDGINNVTEITLVGGYSKEHTRTEITITPIDKNDIK